MTPAEFKLQFPELSTEVDARIEFMIAKAEPYFDVARWEDFYNDGLAYFVAHRLVLAAAAVAAGAQAAATVSDHTSMSVGEVSIDKDGQAVRDQMADPFLRTTYGQEYRRLEKIVGAGGVAL